jgi:hypothetical protein
VNPPTKPPSITVVYGGKTPSLVMPISICTAYDPIKTPKNNIEAKQYNAIWDTGATGTCINKKIANDLNLKPIDVKKMNTVGGVIDSNIYIVNIIFLNGQMKVGVRVAEGIISGGDVLIGMDIITDGDFVITNLNNQTVFSFQIPSTGDLSFHDSAPPDPPVPLPPKLPPSLKVGRNERCPCGSGKKYKHCCLK